MGTKTRVLIDCVEVRNIEGDDTVCIGLQVKGGDWPSAVKAVVLKPDGSMTWYDYYECASDRSTPEGKLPAALHDQVLQEYAAFMANEAFRANELRKRLARKGRRR